MVKIDKVRTTFLLSTMMFFQFIMFAVWWVPMAAYLSNMGFTRGMMALILSSMALGSLASPMVGMLADRYFKAQRVLMVSNLVVALMLFMAGLAHDPIYLFILLLVAMLLYMPTNALISSIALTHAPSEDFSRIRVWGTIGWIMAGIFSVISVQVFHLEFDGTNLPFFFASGLALVAALFNLGLPDTPPRGKSTKSGLVDVMGFRSMTMLRDRNFRIFLILFFFSILPFSMYWFYFSEYLQYTGYQFITLTMSFGQVTEIFILLLIPLFLRRYGLRKSMLVGLIALVLRYLAFYLAGEQGGIVFVLLGVGVHGLIFGFLHLGAQIYTDKKAPAPLKSQAQGLTFFASMGLGMLVGNFFCGWIIRLFSYTTTTGIAYQWDKIWGLMALISMAVLIGFILLFRNETYEPIQSE